MNLKRGQIAPTYMMTPKVCGKLLSVGLLLYAIPKTTPRTMVKPNNPSNP